MTLTSQGQMLPAGPAQTSPAQADPDTPFFVEEPDNITIIAGKKALLRCVVGNVNGRPVQWTFDNFGLGVDRGLSDYPQLRMVGANPQSKSILILFLGNESLLFLVANQSERLFSLNLVV